MKKQTKEKTQKSLSVKITATHSYKRDFKNTYGKDPSQKDLIKDLRDRLEGTGLSATRLSKKRSKK